MRKNSKTYYNKTNIYKRDYSQINEQIFVDNVQSINWDNMVSSNNPDDIFDSIYANVSEIIDQHATLRKLSKKEKKIGLLQDYRFQLGKIINFSSNI